MLLKIVVYFCFLGSIGSVPFILPLEKEKDLKVIDGEFVRKALRVQLDDEYKGTLHI